MPTRKSYSSRRSRGNQNAAQRREPRRRHGREQHPLLELERSGDVIKLRARGLVAYLISLVLVAGAFGYLVYHVA